MYVDRILYIQNYSLRFVFIFVLFELIVIGIFGAGLWRVDGYSPSPLNQLVEDFSLLDFS